uniref:Isochorismatase domain-containing protein 1 n=1 Tax=Ditylenchus dipsaci TaxID=166011 RepID=A0A915DYF3_9BILA
MAFSAYKYIRPIQRMMSTTTSALANPTNYRSLNSKQSALLICDIQEKNREAVDHFKDISTVANRLINAAELLGLKIIATEHQSDHELAHSTPQVRLYERDIPVLEKTAFSMCIPEVCDTLGVSVDTLVICGVEAHVCVFQTALDFLKRGFYVHVVVDAVSSRSPTDRKYALKQLKSFGANLTTAECLMFDAVKDTSNPHFEKMKQIFLENPPDTGLLGQCRCPLNGKKCG